MSMRLVAAACAVVLTLSGCAAHDSSRGDPVDPRSAAEEIVPIVAETRDALGGQWTGEWDPHTYAYDDDHEQFAAFFQQQPAGDHDESEQTVREVWAGLSGEVVRTDRPDGSMEVLLRRDDGLLILMTVTDGQFALEEGSFPGGDQLRAVRVQERVAR